MTVQEESATWLAAMQGLMSAGVEIMQKVQTTGIRSGLPLPSIGDDIDPNMQLQELPFTKEELDKAIADAQDATESASRAEQNAQRAVFVIQAITSMVPKIAALML